MSISRHLFKFLQRLMFLWVRTSVQGTVPQRTTDRNKKGTVVYALRDRSLSDLLVLDRECCRAGLPRPYGSIKGQGIDEPHAYCFLSQPDGLLLQRRRSYNIPRLIRLVRALKTYKDANVGDPDDLGDVEIVPVSIFWGRRPDREKSAVKLLFAWNYNVGSRFCKLLAVIFHGRQTLVHFNGPLSLGKLVDEGLDEERTLRKIHRILRVHFRQLHTSVNGPDLSHRRTLVDGLIHSEVIQRAIEQEVTEQAISEEKARLRARKYANEIVSDYSNPVVQFLDILLTWFWNKIYSGVKVHHIEPVRELAKSYAIVYLPCHRSHIDYLLFSYLLYHQGLQVPHIAAGVNLNMPLVGSILRRAGAFFIRRSFKGNPLYSAVFHEYLHTLFTRGFPTEFFIEGGRSRTGRTLQPKTGMLSIMVRSYLRSHSKPLALVPVYIGYQKVLEARTYMGELRGKKKKKESPLDIVRTLVALKEHFGQAQVNFGEPMLLHNFLDQHQPDWQQQSYDREFRPPWLRGVTNALAIELAGRINTAAAVNPVNMVAMALLNTPRQAMGAGELAVLLNQMNQLLATVPYSKSVTLCPLDGNAMIGTVESLNMVLRQSDSLGDIISMDERHAILMTYYRNNILHLFALPSFICRLFSNTYILTRGEIQDYCARFYPYLKMELFLHWDAAKILEPVNQWLAALTEAGLLIPEGDSFRRPDSSSTAFIILTVLSRAIQPTLERYFVVVSLLLRNGSGRVQAEEIEKQSQDMSQRLSILHGLNAPEFFDRHLFRQFIQALQSQGILSIDSDNCLIFGEQIAQIEKDSRQLLPSEERHTIRQVTWNKPASNDK